MAAGRFQGFFGDDWEDTLDSVLSMPGAFGNIVAAAARQVKPWDALAMALVAASIGWLIVGYVVSANHDSLWVTLSVLAVAAWLMCGTAGGIVFSVGGIGKRALGYWESYLLIALFAVFGTVSLRIALNPKDRLVHRAPKTPAV